MHTYPYKRVLLKLSGEALMGKEVYGISPDASLQMAKEIKALVEAGIQVAIVIGAGNIFRGLQGGKLGIDRVAADQMGMLATMINGIAFAQTLRHCHIAAEVMSALHCYPIVEPYHSQHAIRYLEEGKVVLFVGGTGNPYFTTDTAAALRASEIHAEVILKATKVDGVYSKDPLKHADAVRYDALSFAEVLAQKLDVMDATAIALCMTNKIPILVFNMQAGRLVEIVTSKPEASKKIATLLS